MFFNKKQLTASDPGIDETMAVNEALYKQNLELAIKNKTLSLLRQLYQISILALEPDVLAEKIGKTIQEAFEFELVGFYAFNQQEDLLTPMPFAESARLKEASTLQSPSLHTKKIASASGHPFFSHIINHKTLSFADDISSVWGTVADGGLLKKFQEEVHIKNILAYPLLIDDTVTGIILFGLNRKYEDLIQYEKESIDSFTNVIAVALDRARLYQELQIANKRLGESNARLKELDQMKSQFLSFASHQIRSPLTAIGGYTSMLLEGDFGEMSQEVKDSVQVIDTSSKSLVKIVNEFLDVSRIEQGRMKYEMTDYNVKSLVEEVTTELRPNVEAKKLEFKISVDPADSYLSNGDKGKIKQVIGNIIDNSIKYTLEGSIKVHLKKEDGKFLISVSDTGIGIEQSEIPKLFSMFTRAQDANKTNVTGTGLGLYVARQMVEALKGRVWVESPGKGKGSIFFIELSSK